MFDEPERPVRHGAAERFDARADVILRVDRLADVVQEGRQQELLVIRPGIARQLEDLQAVIERIAFGMIPGVLLHRLQGFQPHLEDGEPVEVIGHRGDPGRLFLEISLGFRRSCDARRFPPQEHELLADLVIRREIARADAVTQDGRRLPLRHVEVIGSGRVQPGSCCLGVLGCHRTDRAGARPRARSGSGADS